MKKIFIAFLLGFTVCAVWLACDAKSRKKLMDIFIGVKNIFTDDLKDKLGKLKQKNATLKSEASAEGV